MVARWRPAAVRGSTDCGALAGGSTAFDFTGRVFSVRVDARHANWGICRVVVPGRAPAGHGGAVVPRRAVQMSAGGAGMDPDVCGWRFPGDGLGARGPDVCGCSLAQRRSWRGASNVSDGMSPSRCLRVAQSAGRRRALAGWRPDVCGYRQDAPRVQMSAGVSSRRPARQAGWRAAPGGVGRPAGELRQVERSAVPCPDRCAARLASCSGARS